MKHYDFQEAIARIFLTIELFFRKKAIPLQYFSKKAVITYILINVEQT